MNADIEIGCLTTFSNHLDTLIGEMKSFQKICSKECLSTIKFALDKLNMTADEIAIGIDELTEK